MYILSKNNLCYLLKVFKSYLKRFIDFTVYLFRFSYQSGVLLFYFQLYFFNYSSFINYFINGYKT
jgi:hypothetical protein